jgi:hypothetical protein
MAADDLDEPSGSGPTKLRVDGASQQRVAREGPNVIQSDEVILSLVEIDYRGDDPPLDESGLDVPLPVEDVTLVFVTLDTSEDPPREDDPGDPEAFTPIDEVELASLELDTSEDPPDEDPPDQDEQD